MNIDHDQHKRAEAMFRRVADAVDRKAFPSPSQDGSGPMDLTDRIIVMLMVRFAREETEYLS